MVHAGVQMRLIIGLMPVMCSTTPANKRSIPIFIKKFNFSLDVLVECNWLPASNPKTMVPKVGIKLSVEYPPPLFVNGVFLGNKFRNHLSNSQAKLVFLFQCAAKPVRLCSQSAVTPAVA